MTRLAHDEEDLNFAILLSRRDSGPTIFAYILSQACGLTTEGRRSLGRISAMSLTPALGPSVCPLLHGAMFEISEGGRESEVSHSFPILDRH